MLSPLSLMDERLTCCVRCRIQPPMVMTMPCGHMMYCHDCYQSAGRKRAKCIECGQIVATKYERNTTFQRPPSLTP